MNYNYYNYEIFTCVTNISNRMIGQLNGFEKTI